MANQDFQVGDIVIAIRTGSTGAYSIGTIGEIIKIDFSDLCPLRINFNKFNAESSYRDFGCYLENFRLANNRDLAERGIHG